jgi:hypothetical protein
VRDAGGRWKGCEAGVHRNKAVETCVGNVVIEVERGTENAVRGEEMEFRERAGEEAAEEVSPCSSVLGYFKVAAGD